VLHWLLAHEVIMPGLPVPSHISEHGAKSLLCSMHSSQHAQNWSSKQSITDAQQFDLMQA
jgi:hypothetical protein